MQTKSAYLVLENGMVFCGQSIGYEAEAIGEIVFSTSMVGCLGTLTDPNFCGQIVVETFPLIGNYGVISKDLESKGTALAAYIVRDLCQEPSNFRSEGALGVFLSEHKVVGLADIDTRALTRIIRSAGSMKAKITFAEPDVDAIRAELAAFCAPNAVEAVTCKEASAAAPHVDPKHRKACPDGLDQYIEKQTTDRNTHPRYHRVPKNRASQNCERVKSVPRAYP